MDLHEKNRNAAVPLAHYAETTPIFTLAELRQRYAEHSSDRSLRNMLYRLKRQGRISILTHGVYAGTLSQTPLNRYAVPAKLRSDAVVALHSALEFHGVANQVFETVYYFSTRARKGLVYEGVTYRSVTPPRQLVRAQRLDFQVKVGADQVRVTGRERSFVDCLMFLDYSGGVDELDRCLPMFPSFDFEAALDYLKLLRRPWLYARLGYMLDRHADKLFFSGNWRDAFLRRLPRGVVYLERKQPGCRWVATWSLMVPETLASASKETEQT